MHRDQNPTFLNSATVSLGLVFGNAETDEAPGNATNNPAGADTGKGGKNRTGRDKRADSRYSNGAYPCEPPQHAADHCASAGAR